MTLDEELMEFFSNQFEFNSNDDNMLRILIDELKTNVNYDNTSIKVKVRHGFCEIEVKLNFDEKINFQELEDILYDYSEVISNDIKDSFNCNVSNLNFNAEESGKNGIKLAITFNMTGK